MPRVSSTFSRATKRAIGPPTLVEACLWSSINLTTGSSEWLEHFIETGPGTVVPFSRETGGFYFAI
jgi:hypothetical protein